MSALGAGRVDADNDYIVVVEGISDKQIDVLKALPGQDFIKLWVAGADQKSIPPLIAIPFNERRWTYQPPRASVRFLDFLCYETGG